MRTPPHVAEGETAMEDSKVETDNARGQQMERNAEDGLHKEVGGEGIFGRKNA